jgi:nicotinamidase-related amidase
MTLPVPIRPESGALLVHDVVNDFLEPAGPEYDPGLASMLENVGALLAAARRAGLAVVFAAPGQGDPAIGPRQRGEGAPTRLVWGTPGVDVPPALGPLPGEKVVRKPRWGGFFGSELAAYLRQTARDTLVVCGLSLAGGVETTVRDAHNHDLQSVVVEDACLIRAVPNQGWGAVSREEVRKVTLSVLAQRFGRVATTREICDELRRPSTPAGRG